VFETAAAAGKHQSSQVSLSGLTITGGDAVLPAGSHYTYAGEGGAIFNSGTLTVTNCVISGNNASLNGGGIFNGGTLTVNNSVLSGDSAGKYGGGLYNYGYPGGMATVSNSTLSGNHAVYGGAIFNDAYTAMTLQGSTLSGNSAFNGAGIFNQAGTLTVSSSTFSNNSASLEGGAIYNGVSYYGPGIGTVTIQNSTPHRQFRRLRRRHLQRNLREPDDQRQHSVQQHGHAKRRRHPRLRLADAQRQHRDRQLRRKGGRRHHGGWQHGDSQELQQHRREHRPRWLWR
jgi:hypothetical protein